MSIGSTILRWRLMRIALLLFEAAWLNIIVPGHQRGIVQDPGEPCAACAAAHAEACHAAGPSGRPGHVPPMPGDPASHCAICHFAAMLMLPPVADFTAPKLELLELGRAEITDSTCLISFHATYFSRGPPASNLVLSII
jgi:hypothetical protein